MVGMSQTALSVLRVVVEGAVTSFRYPYFTQGVQPTYPMPPPATLYGHICSALGELVDLGTFRLGLHFTYQAQFTDYEHTHLFGREPKLSPFKRDLLFRPRLILYLDRPDWLDAFHAPRYVVTLGRSQDLMSYRDAQTVTLYQADRTYVEHTLLPLRLAASVKGMTALTLPRYVTVDRRVTWGQYAMVRQRQLLNPREPVWVDPETERWREAQRAVIWLTCAL